MTAEQKLSKVQGDLMILTQCLRHIGDAAKDMAAFPGLSGVVEMLTTATYRDTGATIESMIQEQIDMLHDQTVELENAVEQENADELYADMNREYLADQMRGIQRVMR